MRLLFAVAVCILHIPFCCASQILDQFHIRNYTDENGLPQNSVSQIVADSSGFLLKKSHHEE